MKRIFTILLSALVSMALLAQAPAAMDFQSLVRDASGNFVANKTIGVEIVILKGAATGTVVYREDHNVKTNANGLLTLTIGKGTVKGGSFTSIDWSAGPYFLRTDMDLNGGTSYTLSQTTQMMSVPYALYAQTAGKVASSGTKDDYEARINALEQLAIGQNPHYPVSHNEIFSSDGAVLAAFSVSASTKVYFSRGNLQYQASTKTWRFASGQYTIIGSANSNISSTYTGWIDLFGWGTGSNPTNTSGDNTKYSTFVDWGKNAISNGGNKANLWRTLSKDEWKYLLESRANATSKYIRATVNGRKGLILLPDTWSGALPPYKAGSGYTASDNVINLYHWDIFESKGAIFLPEAGERNQTAYTGGTLRYWTSTANYILMGYQVVTGTVYASRGYAVRLVRNVQ